jgi:hypothetical protein
MMLGVLGAGGEGPISADRSYQRLLAEGFLDVTRAL